MSLVQMKNYMYMINNNENVVYVNFYLLNII